MDELCGIIAMQGAYHKHGQSLDRCGVKYIEVRKPADLTYCTRLIFPGGESTAIYRLLMQAGLWEALTKLIQQGIPLLGTCAGMILLAKKVHNSLQPCLAAMDLNISRNAYGRQIASFETVVSMEELQRQTYKNQHWQAFLAQRNVNETLPLCFIRAPQAQSWGKTVQPLLYSGKQAVCLQQGKVVVCSFHPELSNSTLFHEYFLSL